MTKTKAGPVSGEAIKGFSDRINNLLDEKQGITSDVGEVYDEAKKAGVNTKALRKIIAKRRAKAPDPEVEAAMEAYDLALDAAAGMVSNGSTSLRKAAKETGFSKSAIQRQVSHRERTADGGTDITQPAAPTEPPIESCGGPQECTEAASLSGPQEDSESTRPNGIPTPPAGVAPGPQDPVPCQEPEVARVVPPVTNPDDDGLTIPNFLRRTERVRA